MNLCSFLAALQMGGNLLTTWSFIHTFRDILGVAPFTVDNLTEHLLLGQSSRVLSTVHISLIRLIQSDMEESHNLVATQVRLLYRKFYSKCGFAAQALSFVDDVLFLLGRRGNSELHGSGSGRDRCCAR